MSPLVTCNSFQLSGNLGHSVADESAHPADVFCSALVSALDRVVDAMLCWVVIDCSCSREETRVGITARCIWTCPCCDTLHSCLYYLSWPDTRTPVRRLGIGKCGSAPGLTPWPRTFAPNPLLRPWHINLGALRGTRALNTL